MGPTLQERAFGVVRKTKQLIGCDAQGLANFVDQGEVRLGLCALVARIAIFVYAEGMRKPTRTRIAPSTRCSRRRLANAARTGGASVLRCLGRGTCYLPRRASRHRRPQRRPGAANGQDAGGPLRTAPTSAEGGRAMCTAGAHRQRALPPGTRPFVATNF